MIADQLAELGAELLLSGLLPPAGEPTSHGPVRLDDAESEQLFDLCVQNRLGPLLGESIRAGRFELSQATMTKLPRALEHILASQLRVEAAGVQVLDALAVASIELRVLKGMATAHLDYPNPALRPFGDLDVLVRTEDMPAAIDALRRLRPDGIQALRGDDYRLQHALPFVIDDVEVDLHHRLLHQAAGHRAAHLGLFDGGEPYELWGRPVVALPAWLRLVQAAAQNVIGGYQQLSSDLDVARLSREIPTAADRCHEVGLGWVFLEGVERAAKNLGWHVPGFGGRPPTWRDRWFERAYGEDVGSVLGTTRLELAMAPPSAGLRLVKSAFFPGSAYLERRGRSRRDQLVRQVERLRSTVGRGGSG